MEKSHSSRSAIILVAVLAGCDLPPGAVELLPAESLTASASIGCPPNGCGSNGPWLGENIRFHELDKAHKPNSAGVKFLEFHDRDGRALELRVNGDRLQGVREEVRGLTVLEGPRLINAVLLLQFDAPPPPPGQNPPPPTFYEVTIKDVDYTGFWTGTPAAVPIYKFEYKKAGSYDNPQLVCDASLNEDSPAFSGLALIFRGDRYDMLHRTIIDTGPDLTWFNIGCLGTAVAKLHLLRHTLAGLESSTDVPVPRRQAMLKMLSADYCGTGRPFTEQGVPLLYAFDQRWARVQSAPFEPWPAWPSGPPPWPPDAGPPSLLDSSPPAPSGPQLSPVTTPLDAVWDRDGAVCLNTARLEHADPAHLERLSPNIRVDIDNECEVSRHTVLKPCPAWVRYDSPWSWTSLGYAISASWLPPPPS